MALYIFGVRCTHVVALRHDNVIQCVVHVIRMGNAYGVIKTMMWEHVAQ